jgi:uncharacterized membrane protein
MNEDSQEVKVSITDDELANKALEQIQPLIKAGKTQQAKVVLSRMVSKYHSGPIPPAEEMRELEAVMPGLADRIVIMAESEQSHRHGIENKIVEREIGLKEKGQFMALVALFALLLAVAYLAYLGATADAVKLGSATIIGVVGIFLTGRYFDNRGESSATPPKVEQSKSQPKRSGRR